MDPSYKPVRETAKVASAPWKETVETETKFRVTCDFGASPAKIIEAIRDGGGLPQVSNQNIFELELIEKIITTIKR